MQTTDLYAIYLRHPQISTDTRQIIPGGIFFALKGGNFNGNDFAAQALDAGAAYVVIDEPRVKKDERYLLADDVLTALQDLARHHRRQLNIPFIGITGSNGKTTTKELTHAALSPRYKTLATKGNLNNHIGVPLTILSITQDIEIAIIEMGANHQQEIAFLCGIAQPDCGIISNVGKAHLEGFGGFEGVKKGKKELYDYLHLKNGVAFINANDSNLMEMGSAIEKKILYGTEGYLDVSGTIASAKPFLNVRFTVLGDDRAHTIQSQLVGDYNAGNILAAIAIGRYFGVSVEQIIRGIESYVPSNNRSQIIHTEYNKIIMDAYNANPSSMHAAIANFAQLHEDHKLMILGDMFELGPESDMEHQALIAEVKALGFTKVIFCGKEFAKHRNNDFVFFETTAGAADYIRLSPIQNHTILVKGSRGMKLESLLELL